MNTENPEAETPETQIETPEAETAPAPEPAEQEPVSRETPSTREALESAFDTVDKEIEQIESEAADREAAKANRERNPDGTFKAKDDGGENPPVTLPAEDSDQLKAEDQPQPEIQPTEKFAEPPSRFSPDAKQAWKEAPEPVRAEINRAIGELEQGIAQYKVAFEPYKGLDDQLRQNGQTLTEVVSHYAGIEDLFRKDPIAGFEQVANNLGISLKEVAAVVMGQPTNDAGIVQDKTIVQLRNEITGLKNELNGVKNTQQTEAQSRQEQIQQQNLAQIEAFAKDHPRFDELARDISFLIESGRASDLQSAYAEAERLNPAPQAPADQAAAQAQAEPQQQQAQPAQTRRKGQLSTTGAPSSGSNPVNKKTPSSAREALENAMAQTGFTG